MTLKSQLEDAIKQERFVETPVSLEPDTLGSMAIDCLQKHDATNTSEHQSLMALDVTMRESDERTEALLKQILEEQHARRARIVNLMSQINHRIGLVPMMPLPMGMPKVMRSPIDPDAAH